MPFIETQALYENTTMREIRNGKNILIGYDIAPADGYVLHNTAYDVYEYDPEEGKQGKLISRGYSPSSSSVEAEYNFDRNPYDIYAKNRDDIDEGEVVY